MFVCLYVYMYIGDISTAISLEPAMKFNGGGHVNHSIFWTNLSPQGGGVPKGELYYSSICQAEYTLCNSTP